MFEFDEHMALLRKDIEKDTLDSVKERYAFMKETTKRNIKDALDLDFYAPIKKDVDFLVALKHMFEPVIKEKESELFE